MIPPHLFRLMVIWASLQLSMAAVALFALGHRLRRERKLAALLLIQAAAWAAWYAQLGLAGAAPPWTVTLVTTTCAGAAVVGLFRDWNPAAHTALSSASVAALAFLAYAAHAVAAARLDTGLLAAAALLSLLQLGAMTLLLAHTFEVVDVVCRTRWAHAGGPKTVPGFAPRVSLHVPIHNEPPELVARTLDALAALRYPDFEVIVVDNNTADEALWRPVELHCARLGPRFRFFHLMPWPGYKAGALNYALSVTDPGAEILGVVDADYVVRPDFLADLVGQFTDPAVAFVQTPQDYRDAEGRGRYGRAMYLAYLYFFKVSMASRNERNAIIYAGTMGLIRRSALTEVGGWDEWCITEDAEVALRLLDRGFRAVYVDRSYGHGLMPLDAAALRRQRYRWAFGGMQLLRKHARKLLLPRRGDGLTMAQRLMFLNGGLQWLNDPRTFAFTVLLLAGAGALLLGHSFEIQPLVGATLLTPLLFVLFAVMRFLWALRLRLRCSWRETADALTVLLGLTWVVTQACARGLVSRRGVFLRTPKQGPRPTVGETLRGSRFETLLGVASALAAGGLLLAPRASHVPASARGLVVALLLWQAMVYLSAVRSGFWNYAERRDGAAAGGDRAQPRPARTMRLRFASRVATGCLLLLLASPARAEAQALIGGWEGSAAQGYGFVSPEASLPLAARFSMVARGAASYLYYQLPEPVGFTDVTSPGLSGGLALRLRLPGATLTAGTSYEGRRTLRRFADGTSTVTQERGLTSQADVFAQPTPLTVQDALVSSGTANRYLGARGGAERQITDTRFQGPVALAIGVEGTAQGNSDVRSLGAGGLIALNFLRLRASLQLRAGYARLRYADGSQQGRIYVGVGLYQAL